MLGSTNDPELATIEQLYRYADWLADHYRKRVLTGFRITHSLAVLMGKRFTLPGQLVDQRRVVRFNKSVEKCLLGLMPFVGNVAKAMPINRGRLSLPCANMLCLGNQWL